MRTHRHCYYAVNLLSSCMVSSAVAERRTRRWLALFIFCDAVCNSLAETTTSQRQSSNNFVKEAERIEDHVVQDVVALFWGKTPTGNGGLSAAPATNLFSSEGAGAVFADAVGEDVASHGVGKQLQSFCGYEFSGSMLVECGCCGDHLLNDTKSKAALMFGSGPVQALTLTHDSSGKTDISGHARAWSVGGFVPTIWCDRGRLVCRCQDAKQGWHEEERACRPGAACAPPQAAKEGSTGDAQGSSTSASPVAGGETASLPSCATGTPARLALGSSTCEDASVRQCDRLYARGTGGSWHYCKVDTHAVKICGARVLEEDEARRITQLARSWGLQHLFNPALGWGVEDGLSHVAHVAEQPLPPVAVFQNLVRQRTAQG